MINNQKGAAAIIVVTLTTVLISVLTVATTKLMTGEVRQAIDSESGIKAYYLAESSIEEGIAAIRVALADGRDLEDFNQNCDQDGTEDLFESPPFPAPANGITCRIVQSTTNSVQDERIDHDSKDAVDHYDLSKSNFNRIELSWDNDPPGTGTFSYDLPNSLNPNSPPVFELTRITYTDTSNGPAATVVDPDSLSVKSLLLVPTTGNPGSVAPTAADLNCGTVGNEAINFSSCLGATGGSVNVNCTQSPGKRCKATITDFIPTVAGPPFNKENRVVLRLRPYYHNVVYDMELYQADNLITFNRDSILLDITAVVGDSYRRIIDEFDVTGSPGPYDVIFGDEGVCKDLTIESDDPSGEGANDEVRQENCFIQP